MDDLSKFDMLRALKEQGRRIGQTEVKEVPGNPQTWTPTMIGGTSAGVTTYAAGGQAGHYMRIGPLIYASALVSWTAATGTGVMRFSLPFAAIAGAGRDYAAAIYTENVVIGSFTPYGLLLPGNNYIELYTPSSGGASSGIAVEAAGVVIYTIMYIAG